METHDITKLVSKKENNKNEENDDFYDNFPDMNLKEELLRGIYSYGFEYPSTIQSKAIIPIINKFDLIAQSQSGTGKTGAFAIGALQHINENVNRCQVIAISHTRELAIQTHQVFTELAKYMKINIMLCIGGTSIKDSRNQIQNAQLVIGTPGRILDMITKKWLITQYTDLLILDEADELLTGGFQDNIKQIIRNIPSNAQICIFSATIPTYILNVTDHFMRNPKYILVKQEQLTLEGIKQYYIYLEQEEWKKDTFCDLYEYLTVTQTIVYVNTKRKAEWLKEKLSEMHFVVSIIHSDMSANERSIIIKQFRSGCSRILISTDLLSRGIDIQQVSVVINYDIPNNKENYLHRIGRSGRYGRKGIAISFITPRDIAKVKDIESYFKIKLESFQPSTSK